jgi:hypothetical protein
MWTTVSESLDMVEAKSHEARAKGERATISSEAGRQRGTPNPKGLRHPYAEPQAVTCSEPGCSAVIAPRSNAVSGSAEPLPSWRRQNPSAIQARPVELPGVSGTACGEGYPREGGSSSSVPYGVGGAISVTREMHPDALLEVRGDRSSREAPVTGVDAKGLRFRREPLEAKGSPYSPRGVSSGRCAREPRVALFRPVKAARRGCDDAGRRSLSVSVVRKIRPLRLTRGGRRGETCSSFLLSIV